MRCKPWRILLLTFVGISLVGCGEAKTSAPPAPTIRVAAASDLQRAFPILASRFKLDTGIDVIPTFGASGTLAEQIRGGAPFDVFLSADRAYVESLKPDQLVKPSSIQLYARGTLALVVPKTTRPGGIEIQTIADLEKPQVKAFAFANPSFAPYGRAAKQVLEKKGLWDTLEPKRVPATNVREALQFLESGNVDAAFVGSAMAKAPGVRSIPIDPALHEPILQALGILTRTQHAEEAERFAQFLLSDAGQGILRDLGFSTVPPESTKLQAIR